MSTCINNIPLNKNGKELSKLFVELVKVYGRTKAEIIFSNINLDSDPEFTSTNNEVYIQKGKKNVPINSVYSDSQYGIFNIPIISSIQSKSGVSELFESNPELANKVYEALGFGQEGSISITPKANIPQNLVSGVEAFGTKQEANSKAKALLGNNPNSIDMIEAGIRTRTTRSVGEMSKYNVKVGDIVKQFGKSADGTTKNILTRITAIHPKGSPEFLSTWEKEGWTDDGIKAIERFKDGAAAIEFEVITINQITPEQKQQAQQLYSQYLDTIFPDSKVKDIVYHGGKVNKEPFKRFVDKTKYEDRNPNSILGFFFSSSENIVAAQYAEKDYKAIKNQLTGDPETDSFILRSAPLKKGSVSEELLNIKNPYIIQAEEWENETWVDKLNILTEKDKDTNWVSDYKWTVDAYEKVKNYLQSLGYDGLYINSNKELFNKTGIVDYITVQKVVFEPEQIHILGSKQDIQGFKEFVEGKSFDKELAQKIQDILEKLYPEIKLNITNNPVWENGDNVMNQQSNIDAEVQYRLKAFDILLSDKAKQVFTKGEKNKWSLDKILTELAIPKEQKKLLLDLGIQSREQLALELASKYGYTVEINTAKVPLGSIAENEERIDGGLEGENTKTYDYLSARNFENKSKYKKEDGWEYAELDIVTPLIQPSIESHAGFANKKNSIGWARVWYNKKTGTVEIQEIQSDLFQKGRDLDDLVTKQSKSSLDSFSTQMSNLNKALDNNEITLEEYRTQRTILEDNQKLADKFKNLPDNQFLQLLNKDNNWVTFFIKSIIQDSAKKGYEKVLFPKGETAAKIEGHETIANLIDSKKERIEYLQSRVKYQNEQVKDITERNKNIEIFNNEIKQLEKEIIDAKSQGIEKLKPIEAFYEIKVGNILEKQFGKDNVKTITDEYGNQWREITINQARDLQNILLQRNEADKIIGQANIKAMTVLVDAINQKQDTLPHEYAHHYIAWFRDTPIVQEAIKKWGSEEALVESIGIQSVNQKGEAWNWWNKFVNWILSKVNKLSDLDKQELTNILTDAFLTRSDLNILNNTSLPLPTSKNSDLGLTDMELKYAVNIANTIIVKNKTKLQTLIKGDISNNKTVRKKIHTSLLIMSNRNFQSGKITKEQHETNRKIAKAILNNDKLWDKIKLYAINNLGIFIDDEVLEQEDDRAEKNWNDELQLKEMPDNRISADVKNLICSTIKLNKNNHKIVDGEIQYINNTKDTNNVGGIETMLSFSETYKYLVQNLASSKNINDMMTRLNKLSDTFDPSYKYIIKELEKDEILKNRFFSNFKSSTIPKLVGKLEDKDITISNIAEDAFVHRQLSNAWNNNFSSRFAMGYFKANKETITNLINELNTPYNKSNLATKAIAAEKIFDMFGMSIDADTIVKFCNNYFKYNNNLPSSVSDKLEDNQKVFTSIVLVPINKLYKRYISPEGKNKIPNEFDDRSILISLAKEFGILYYPDSVSYMNINGDSESGFNKPCFISDLFEVIQSNDKEALNLLSNMAKVPYLKYSNWLLSNPLPENNLLTANKNSFVLNKCKLELGEFAGINYNGIVRTYTTLKDREFERVKLLYFLKDGIFFQPSPSDRGRILTIKSPIIGGANSLFTDFSNGILDHSNNLFIAMQNAYKQEVYRIQQAIEAVTNEDNTINTNPDLFDNLIEEYHYKIINGVKTIVDKNGKLVGNAFKIYNFDILHNRSNTTYKIEDFVKIAATRDFAKYAISDKSDKYLDVFISAMCDNDLVSLIDNKAFISTMINPRNNKLFNYNTSIISYSINSFLFNKEYENFVQGSVAFYGSPDKANKRNSIPTSTGLVNASYGNIQDTFNHAVIEDLMVVPEKHLKHLKDTISALQRKNKISDINAKLIIDAYSKAINAADAMSYITLDEFVKRMKLRGLYNDYADMINNLYTGDITNQDLDRFIELQKNIYAGYDYDSKFNMMMPKIIKNSEMVLIPQIIKGTELEVLNDIMINNDIQQISFKSASKASNIRIARIFKDGKLNISRNSDNSINSDEITAELIASKEVLQYRNLRTQLDVVSHIKDTKNKIGSRMIDKLLDNVTDANLLSDITNIRIAKLRRSALAILNELTNENKELVLTKLKKILYDSIIESGSSNDILAIELDELTNTFNMPLDFSLHRKKVISKILSIFNNNVTRQTLPGVHGPQASNALMNDLNGAKLKRNRNILKPLKYAYFKDGDKEYIKAQILLPASSKKFITNGKTISIDELKASGLDTMLGYRMPTEDKHSYMVFEIVGFLPEAMGSTIVVPKEIVTQMGSDFDIDTLYTMNYHFTTKKNKDGSVVYSKVPFMDETTDINDRYIKYVNELLKSKDLKDIKKQLQKDYNMNVNEYYESLSEKFENAKEAFEATKEIVNNIRENLRLLGDKNINRYLDELEKDYTLNEIAESFIDQLQVSIINPYQIAIENKNKAVDTVDIKTTILKLDWLNTKLHEIYTREVHKANYVSEVSDKVKKFAKDYKLFNAESASEMVYFIPTLEEFSTKYNIYEQNTIEALDNKLLDDFVSIISDIDHFVENTSPNRTDSVEQGRDLISSLQGKETIDNYLTREGQAKYRSMNINGRSSKSISINRDKFLSFALRTNLGLVNDINIRYATKFDVSIKPLYDFKRITKPDKIVKLSRFGSITHVDKDKLDSKLSNTNHIGAILTSYCAQTTANILDNVAKRLDNNFIRAFGVFRTLIELGTDMNFAHLFVNQYAINELLDNKYDKEAFYNEDKSNTLLKSYNKYLSLLLPYYYNGNNPNKGTLFSKDEFTKYEAFLSKKSKNFNLNLNFERVGQILDELGKIESTFDGVIDEHNMIKYINDSSSTKEVVLHSLNILKNYDLINRTSDDIDYFITHYDQDRNGLFKSFDNYKDVNDFKEFTNLKLSPDDIYTNVNSLDPILNEFNSQSNELSYKLFHDLFIENTSEVKAFRSMYNLDEGIINDIFAYMIRKNEFLRSIDYTKLLSIKDTYDNMDITNLDNLQKFSELGVIEQLIILQNTYKKKLDPNHIIMKLIPLTMPEFIKRAGYPGISFDMFGEVERYIDDFRAMWDCKDNPYFHVFAQNLIKYSYINNGFTYGKNVSKIIPLDILYKDLRVLDTINGVNILEGIGISSTYYKALNYLKDNNFSNNPFGLKYAIDYYRRNPKLAPIATTILKFSEEAEGKVPDSKYPVWSPNIETGLIKVTSKQFTRANNDIKKALVVRVKNRKTKSYDLYAKIAINAFKVVNGKPVDTILYYYVPVNQLGKYEFTDYSLLNIYNKIMPIEYYFQHILNDLRNNDLDLVGSEEYSPLTASTIGEYYNYKANDNIVGNDIVLKSHSNIKIIPVNGVKNMISDIDIITGKELGNPVIYNGAGEKIDTEYDKYGVPTNEFARRIFGRYMWSNTFGIKGEKALQKYLDSSNTLDQELYLRARGLPFINEVVAKYNNELYAFDADFKLHRLFEIDNKWTIEDIKKNMEYTASLFDIKLPDINYANFEEVRNSFNILENKVNC